MKGTFVIGGDFDFTTPDETRGIVKEILRAERGHDNRRAVFLPRTQSVVVNGLGEGLSLVFNFGEPPPNKMWYVTSMSPLMGLVDGAPQTLFALTGLTQFETANPIAIMTIGPARLTGSYADLQINYADVVDWLEWDRTIGASTDLQSTPRWTGWRYGSIPGLPVMGGANLAVTVTIGDYDTSGASVNFILNAMILEIDESASVRGGTP